MSHPKIQHYVPRFMLANFARPGLEQVYVFDKKTGRSFPTNIKKAAAENGFYDVPLEDVTLTIEPALSFHEAKAAEVIKRVVETPNLHLLSMDQQLLEHHNSMQVVNAERFIFSVSDEFTLARHMIDRHPELKRGPQLAFG